MTDSNQELMLPSFTIEAEHDLKMTLLKGNEGIGVTYLTKLTYKQCADFFELEDSLIPTHERLQRDADKSRVNGIFRYLTTRTNTVFPSACLIVSDLELEMLVGGEIEVFTGNLPAKSDRLFIDGQGRVGAIKAAILENPSLESHHLDVKVIVVPTKTIRESSQYVRQVFSDFHYFLKKPNSSQNIFFDNENSSSRLAKEVLDITEGLGINFNDAIAVNGKINHGQLYTLASLTDFIAIMVGEKGKVALNKLLDDENNYNLYLSLITDYILGMYEHLPFEKIQKQPKKQDWKLSLDSCVLTCAIGLKALAYLGRSLIDDALINEQSSLNLKPLLVVAQMPINNRQAKYWMENDIYQTIEGKTKIVKSSEKRLARLMCNQARVLPCKDLV